MNRTKYVISLLLIGMLLLGYVGEAEAAPPTPNTFHGEIQFAVDDVVPTTTDYVDVYMLTGEIETYLIHDLIQEFDDAGTIKLVYSVDVPGDDPDTTPGVEGAVENQALVFKINGRIVAKSTWHSGASTTLHLHPPAFTETNPVSVTMSEDGIPTPWSLTLHAADMSVGDVITWSISTAASHGTATASGTGTEKSIGYMPTTDYVGEDSFVVKVTDSQGGEDFITVNVTITKTTYNLVVTNTGENGGSGTVISSPPGIDCGELCSYAFTEGTEVTLTATPAEGSLFMDWSGACSGTSTCILTMTENKAVTATFNASLDLMGTVREGTTGLAGVVMTYGTGLSVTTGSDGGYLIKVPYGWSGTVTPSKAGYTFSPTSKTYSNYTAALTEEDYSATLISYTVSGYVGVVEGVTITYTGGSTTTNSSGYYSFQVPYGWTGIVTPSKAGYTFVPPSYPITEPTYSNLQLDFIPTQLSYTITGNAGVAGASLAYTGGAEPVVADSSGNYTITVSWGWDGTVTPSKLGYSFTPPSRTYTDIIANQTAQNYTATLNTYTISGNADIEGVLITYTGGTTTTDTDGNYSFTVNYGWTGTVTPTLLGYVFDPINYTYITPIAADLPNQDFTATQIKHSISLSLDWNLVSFNVVPLDKDGDSDIDIEDVLFDIDGKYNLVYAWDASVSSNNWLKYDPSTGVGNTLTTLSEKQGFWIRMTVADTLDVYGSAYPTSTAITLNTEAGGWNLVGFPADNNLAMPGALDSNGLGPDTARKYTLVYGYRATDATDPWELYDPAAPAYVNDMIEMVPGMGYWIKVTEAATWTVPY